MTGIVGLQAEMLPVSVIQVVVHRQQRQSLPENPTAAGGSCVVIDVRTREILALVSVPTFDWETYREDYGSLRDDAWRRPLVFRAVQQQVPPGSTIKPVALLAALANKAVKPDRAEFCDGALIPGAKHWHCWTHWRDIAGHGPINAVDSIQHSCNVYYYKLGQRVGRSG